MKKQAPNGIYDQDPVQSIISQRPLIKMDAPEFDDSNISERETRKHAERRFSPGMTKEPHRSPQCLFLDLLPAFLAISGILV